MKHSVITASIACACAEPHGLISTNQRARRHSYCSTDMAETMKPSGNSARPLNESSEISSYRDCVRLILKHLADFGKEVGRHRLSHSAPSPIVLIRVVSNMLMFLASRCSLKSQRSRYSPNLTTTLFFQQAGRKLLLIIKSYFDFLFDMYILHSDSTTRIQIE